MKRSIFLLALFSLLTFCNIPGGRSWIIPVTLDPTDLEYTPDQMESFELRRSQVLSNLEEGVVILRSNDQESYNPNEFKPNSYFYYLTGFEAPNTIALLRRHEDAPYILITQPRSIRRLIYEGEPMADEMVKTLFRPDRILSHSWFRNYLDSILQRGGPVYLDMSDRELVQQLKTMTGDQQGTALRRVSELVDELRVIKGAPEVERLQKACDITSLAIVRVMKECSPGRYEFEMESILEGTFRQYGAAMPGFPSIMGSGPNSTILHYEPNTRLMEDGELLLMDVGASYGHYTADITRTIPVNGRFSEAQRTIYQLVLDAQTAAIDSLKPGNMIGDGHRAASEVIIRGLYKLGLMTDTLSAWQARFYILYPSSHYLGLDVHDVGDYGGFFAGFGQESPRGGPESRVLEPGMVITIEPGLYFREKGLEQLYEIFGSVADSTEIDAFIGQVAPEYEKYVNIGVRIEDDILITKDGKINLSRYAPKEVEDIEQIMR